MGIRDVLYSLWPSAGRHASRAQRPKLAPSEASLRIEAETEAGLAQAMKANNRASMGVVVCAGQAMKAESRVQAMLRDVLREVDRNA